MIRYSTTALAACLVSGTTTALADFDGPYEMQHWTTSGIEGGTTSITPDSGPADSAVLSYDVQLDSAPSGVSLRTADFSAVAAADGYATLTIEWSGFHSWFQATGIVTAFAEGPSGREEITIYDRDVWGFFDNTAQAVSIEIHSGYPFGIVAGGSNFDGAGIVRGSVEVTDFAAIDADNLPPIRYGIDTDEAYRSYLDAVFVAESIRQDHLNSPRPDVFGAIAGLVAFAERNPHATRAQLEAFAIEWHGALLAAFDSDLSRVHTAELISAMRFRASVEPAGLLRGIDTRIGANAIELLGINFEQTDPTMTDREYRLWQLERAKTMDLTWAPTPAELLVRAGMGVDRSDAVHPGLSDATHSVLVLLGAGSPANGDDVYPMVQASLDAAPQTMLEYHIASSNDFAAVRNGLNASLERLRLENQSTIAQIADRLAGGLSIEDAWENGFDSDRVDAEIQRRRETIERLADERSSLAFGTMILSLSPEFEDRQIAREYRDFSGVSLQVNQTAEDVNFGLEVAGGISDAVLGAFTGDPVAAVGGLLDLGGTIFGQFGDDTPSPDEQIFDEIIELRQQVEDMRAEVNERFDRIDSKLNAVFLVLSDGLGQINQTTMQIDANVRRLQRQLSDVTSELRAIETRLTTLLQEARLSELVAALDSGLGFRVRTTVDMPYLGADSFTQFESRFYTWCTGEASTDTFAPKNGSVGEADTLITGNLHEQINRLARMSDELIGRPPATYSFANPVIFAQAADAYAQLAGENPWYFARTQSRIGAVSAEGEATRDFMRSLQTESDPATDPIAAAEAMYLDARGVLYADLYDPSNPASALWSTLAAETPLNLPSDWLIADGVYFDLWAYDPSLTLPIPVPYAIESVFEAPSGTFLLDYASLPPFLWESDLIDAWHLGMDVRATWGVVINDNIDVDGGADDFTVGFSLSEIATGRSDRWVFDVNIQRFYPGDGFGWIQDETEAYLAIRSLLSGPSATDAAAWLIAPGSGAGTIEFVFDSIVYRAEFMGSPSRIQTGSHITHDLIDRHGAILRAIGHAFADRVIVPTPDSIIAFASIDDSAAVLNGLLSLAVPESMASNQVIRSAFRGSAAGSLVVRADAVRASLLAIVPPSPDEFFNRFDAPRLEWALARNPGGRPQTHAYLEWAMLGLEAAQRDKLRLAHGDTYVTPGNRALVVTQPDGLLANDAEQTTVNESARVLVTTPDGLLSLDSDGSLTFEPDPGFVGDTAFTYAAEWVWGDPALGQVVTSEPATVLIRVTQPECEADLDGDGQLTFFDITAYIGAFNNGDPSADIAAPFGSFDFFDIVAFVGLYNAGCP